MAELWNKAADQYDLAARLLDPESELCGCLTDVRSNGVWQHVNLVALKIRYPGITSGNETLTDRYIRARQKRSPYRIAYDLSMEAQVLHKRLGQFDFNRSDMELL